MNGSGEETAPHDSQTSPSGPTNHLALVFETPREQLAGVIPFVRAGLNRGERVMYVAHETPRDSLLTSFREAGIDVDAALEADDLSVHSTDEQYDGGTFDPDAMISFLDETARAAVHDDGYDGLRITGEMTWALEADESTLAHLVEYEGKLNDFYPDKPVVGLCQYDRTRFPGELLHDIIRAHPHQVYDATVTQNLSYLPPDEFFATERGSVDAADVVDLHLDRLRTQSQRDHHKETLSTLAESSHQFLSGDADAVLERAVKTIGTVASPSLVAGFVYDDATDSLEANTVWTPQSVDTDDVSLPDRYREALWEAYVAGEDIVVSNSQPSERLPALDVVLQSGVVSPLGRHGVLFVASTRATAFDEAAVEAIQTVAHSAVAGLDRVENERDLAEQNAQLQQLDRINRTIRRIDQALVRATSRAEIEEAVCSLLAGADSYEFAWIGGTDPLTGRVRPREWAGSGVAYLDELYPEPGDDDRSEGGATTGTNDVPTPTRVALDQNEPQYVPNALTVVGFDEWRRVALENGHKSVLSVPLVHEKGHPEGVLNVYQATPNGMNQMERTVLQELGATIAYAIDATETKASLRTNRVTEVSYRLAAENNPLHQFAARLDSEVDVKTIVPMDGDSVRLFLTVPGNDADEVLAVGERANSISSIRRISDREGASLFEAILDEDHVIPPTVRAFNGVVTEVAATPDAVTVVVDLPASANVRAFADELVAEQSTASVESIRRVEQPLQTRESFYSSVEDRLTERQLEALRLAYHNGYFEWPRESTATEVATAMGVAQPTFTGHLRVGERKVFELLFED
ncbi:MEDS domain-containing protein [Halomarina litorea]|uniref:MEDS domain-containing protein n=1 Tax=Halomarina litorea TaxID=2961595 RepID=UPI0020C3628C|nr:MEDS domain-containing protein [Halomarina sp. BCD28]